MNRALVSILAAAASAAIVSSAQATVLLQDDFSAAAGTSLATTGWTLENHPSGTATAATDSTVIDVGNSALFSGAGASWSQNFSSPYTLQAGDVLTAQVYVTFPNGSPEAGDGSHLRKDQVHLILRGTDTTNAGRSYELGAYDYGYIITNNSMGSAYAIDGGIYGYGTVQKWLKMVYTVDTHTLQNFTAPANDPTNWRLFSTDSNMTMQNFTGIALVGGAYSDTGTTQYADTVSVTVAPVPEPAALGLLALGAFGILRRRNRA